MDWLSALGGALSLAGVAGYVAGTAVAYPGRSFTVAAVMVGLTLFLVGRGEQP